ncbi:MAG TPA: AMP-binding protein [Streptosporangiaceae bacterium]|jgi:2-aminobenzoate-CoA ligase
MQLSPSAHTDTFCRDNLPPDGQWPAFSFPLPELRYPDRLNCAAELIDATVQRYGAGRPCLLSASGDWSYGDLLIAANRVARVLTEDFGIVPGNRVLLRGPNAPWLVACWAGVIKAGAVAVTTMPLLRAGEIATIGEIARPVLALCDHRFTWDLASAEVPGMTIVKYGTSQPDDLIQLAGGKPGDHTAVATAADDVALIAFTSGTTGRPKATMHFHRDVLAIADTFSARVLRPVADDVFTGTPPLAFTYGLGGAVVFPLRAGASTLLVEKAAPDDLAAQIAARNVTVCFTAPTGYRAMLASGQAARLRGLRHAVSAGEHLPASTWQAFYAATGVRIIDGIGSTEMLHIFISASGDDIVPGSTGKAVPGYTAAVLDDNGVPVPDGTIGRLAVKGPTGCRYLADDRQRSYVQNGWNLTGDTYLRDPQGYYWYQARSDDIIISSGYNIAGPEIEEALLLHPDVAECGVVGVPDETRGQVVTAYVVLRGGVAASESTAVELQDFVKQQIAPYKYPRQVRFLSALPRTTTGKLQRFRLREDGAGSTGA